MRGQRINETWERDYAKNVKIHIFYISKRELPIGSTSTTPYGEYYSLYGVVKNPQIHSCGKIFEFYG